MKREVVFVVVGVALIWLSSEAASAPAATCPDLSLFKDLPVEPLEKDILPGTTIRVKPSKTRHIA